MKLEIEIGDSLLEYMNAINGTNPYCFLPIEEQIREYLEFCAGTNITSIHSPSGVITSRKSDDSFKKPLKTWLLHLFGEQCLPEDMKE